MDKAKDIIDCFFECFTWEIENIYEEAQQKQIKLFMQFMQKMYDLTMIEFNVSKKPNEDFVLAISKDITKIYVSVFDLNCSSDDLIISFWNLYNYLFKTYTDLRSTEFGAMYDKWIQSGHIHGGLKIKEIKENEYKEIIFPAFLTDWCNGEYSDCKTYLDTIEEIKTINNVGMNIARRMYREASKIMNRKNKKTV